MKDDKFIEHEGICNVIVEEDLYLTPKEEAKSTDKLENK